MKNESIYICLECGVQFKNTLEIAVCSKCLEKEKKNHKNGITSKYNTVSLLLNGYNF